MSSERLVIAFAGAGHALYHVLAALFLTLVLVLAPAWGRSYDELISLWTWGAFLVGLGAPVAGWASDRWGESRVMIVFFLGIGAATVLCGLADGPPSLEFGLILLGGFGAIYHPVGTAWVVKHTARRGRSIAIVGISGSIGLALASLIAALLADLAGWRTAFILPGVVSIAVGMMLLWAYTTARVGDAPPASTDDAEADVAVSRNEVRRAVAAIVVTSALTSVVYYAFSTVLPKWMERELGPALGEGIIGIGAVVTLIYLLGTSAQFLGGWCADRGLAKALYVASFAAKCTALLIASVSTGWPVALAAVVVVFVFDLAAPVENVLIARYAPRGRRGLAYGIRNGIGIVAAPAGVQLVALLFDPSRGVATLLQALAVIALLLILAALMLPRERPRLAAVA